MKYLSVWLTPLWLLSVGMIAGAAALLAVWGVIWLIHRPAARAIAAAVGEGILRPISYVLIAVAALTLLAAPTMPWREMVASLRRLPYVAPVSATVTVEANTDDAPLAVSFR